MRQSSMPKLFATLVVAALAMAVAACGSSSSTSSKPPSKATNIDVKSAAMLGERIPARYTCDGQNISPPLEWGTVPAGVKQLALFLVAYRPTSTAKAYKVTVEWAVAGLSPHVHRLAAGQLPAGARLGSAYKGRKSYSLCPAKGTSVHYQFELYGVPSAMSIPAQFSGLHILTSLNARSGPTRATAHGGFVAIYSRAA